MGFTPVRKIGRDSWVAVTIAAVIVAAVLAPHGLRATLAQGPRPMPAPPAPGAVPPNASRVVARVIQESIWPAGALHGATPPVASAQVLFSLTLEIDESSAVTPGLESLAQPGTTIEAFSSEALPSELRGKRIEATVTLTGDTRGVRWQISQIRVNPG